jgi:methyl-accepting chemotaxis protein
VLSAVPLLALIVLGGILILQLNTIEDRGRYVAELQLPSVVVIGNITRKHAELRVDLRDYLLAAGDKERAAVMDRFLATAKILDSLLDHYSDTLISDERDRRLLGEYRQISLMWLSEAKTLIAIFGAGRREEAMDRLVRILPELGERSHKTAIAWAEYNERLARESSQGTVSATRNARFWWWVGIVLSVGITAALAFWTFQRIVVPLQEVETSVKAIAGGDYSQKVPFTCSSNEIGSLARSVDVLKKSAEATAEHRWVSASAGAVTTGLQGATSLAEFGRRLLSELMPMLGGGVAGFYAYDENAVLLRRVADYGLGDGDAPHSFSVGDGLVGQ